MKKTIFSTFTVGLCLLAQPAASVAEDIQVPDGFKIQVFAEDLDGIRGLTVSPSGDVYGKVRKRGVVAMRDANKDGVAEQVRTVPSSPKEGSGIGYYDGYLYYSTNSEVLRRKLRPGTLMPQGAEETIVSELGDGGQHNSKMFTFDDEGNLYVEVGAPSNSLGEPDRAPGAKGLEDAAVDEYLSKWAGIWRFDAREQNQKQATGYRFSTGSRHILSLDWSSTLGALVAVQNGRDVINVVDPTFSVEYNAERVAEELHIIRDGANLGWPYTYYDPIDKVRLFSPEYGGDGKKQPEPGRFQDPAVALPAHWAPMQMELYNADQFPERYRGGAFVAFHGSWNRAPEQKGYNVCFIPFGADGMPSGDYEVFADGFMGKDSIASPGAAEFRPMGIAVGPDGSLYIGADKGGRVWKVTYTGK